MDKRESTAEIRFCMKQEIRRSYGWANRESDPFVKNHPNEEFIKSCNNYWGALRHAWYTYSKGNTLAQEAKEERDDAIQMAKDKYLCDDENYDSKTFLKVAYQIYDKYANKIAPVFHEFKKEIQKEQPIVL